MKLTKIKPLFTTVVTTANRYKADVHTAPGSIIIDTARREGSLKEYQTVVAVGDIVRNIKVGDVVMINPRNYAKMKHQEGSLKDGIITDNVVTKYEFNMIKLDGNDCLMLQDRDIEFIMEEFDEDGE